MAANAAHYPSYSLLDNNMTSYIMEHCQLLFMLVHVLECILHSVNCVFRQACVAEDEQRCTLEVIKSADFKSFLLSRMLLGNITTIQFISMLIRLFCVSVSFQRCYNYCTVHGFLIKR